jgi:DnaJ-class molecular chaperone
MMLCPKCRGKGTRSIQRECPDCHGRGHYRVQPEGGFEESGRPQSVTCPTCKGKRHLPTEIVDCDKCAGTGQVKRVVRDVTCPECTGSGQIWVPTGELTASRRKQKQRLDKCPKCLGKRTD